MGSKKRYEVAVRGEAVVIETTRAAAWATVGRFAEGTASGIGYTVHARRELAEKELEKRRGWSDTEWVELVELEEKD